MVNEIVSMLLHCAKYQIDLAAFLSHFWRRKTKCPIKAHRHWETKQPNKWCKNVNFAKPFFLLCRRRNNGVDNILHWWRPRECLWMSFQWLNYKDRKNKIESGSTQYCQRWWVTSIQRLRKNGYIFTNVCSVNQLHVFRGREKVNKSCLNSGSLHI